MRAFSFLPAITLALTLTAGAAEAPYFRVPQPAGAAGAQGGPPAGTNNGTVTGGTGSGGAGAVAPLALRASSPPATAAQAGSQLQPVTFSADGGVPPVTLQQTGSVPPGMTLDTVSGVFQGMPTKAGTYTFGVLATDAKGSTQASPAYTMTVQPAPALALRYLTQPPAETIAGYTGDAIFQGTGGIPPYQVTTSGTLPGGMRLEGSRVTGTYTQPGQYAYDINLSDSSDPIQFQSLHAATAVYGVLGASGFSGGNPTVLTTDTGISMDFGTYGGKPPLVYKGINLPPGLYFDNGSLHGTPTTPGTYSVTLLVTDAFSQSVGTGPFALTVNRPALAVPSPAVPDFMTVGTAITDVQAPASGGMAPYTYSVTGTLPTGLSYLNGVMSGTPTAAGRYTFQFTATDKASQPATARSNTYIVDVAQPLAIGFNTLNGATNGVSYSFTPSATGGTPSLTWTLTGTLPTGLSFDGTKLFGTPSQEGTFPNLIFKATDAKGRTAVKTVSLTVASLPSASNAYLTSVTLTGANSGYRTFYGGAAYSVNSGYEVSNAKNSVPTTVDGYANPIDVNMTAVFRYTTPVKSTRFYITMSGLRNLTTGQVALEGSMDGTNWGTPVIVNLTSANVVNQYNENYFGGTRATFDVAIPQIQGNYLRIRGVSIPGTTMWYLLGGGFR